MSGQRVSFAVHGECDDSVARAVSAFRRDGLVVLDDLIDPAEVVRALETVECDHPGYTDRNPTKNFGLYPGRFTVPLPIQGALAERSVLCPPVVLAILQRVLGAAFVMDSFGILVSLPNAGDQAWHPDALLFPDTPVDRLMPPIAIAFALPLVRMDELSGCTSFRCGSHLDPAQKESEFVPVVPVGSALLWDFRVIHRGLANRSGRPRPVAFTVFCRDWWVEVPPKGAHSYEKLSVARSAYEGFDKELRRRTGRARIVD